MTLYVCGGGDVTGMHPGDAWRNVGLWSLFSYGGCGRQRREEWGGGGRGVVDGTVLVLVLLMSEQCEDI